MNKIYQKRLEGAAKKNVSAWIKAADYDTVKAKYIEGGEYILANLWIPVAQELPELVNQGTFSKWSDDVLVRFDNGQVRQSAYWQDKEPHGPLVSKGWFYIGREKIKITHWMPIPNLSEGGDQ